MTREEATRRNTMQNEVNPRQFCGENGWIMKGE